MHCTRFIRLVHTFPMAGAVPYHCIAHFGVGMVGTVTVEE
jgi:plastocyanin